jgi:predicted oxidoreductase
LLDQIEITWLIVLKFSVRLSLFTQSIDLRTENIENVEIATKCTIELLFLSRNIENYKSIKEYIESYFDKLLACASNAI